MAYLPELNETTYRILDLEWQELREKHKFDGEHLNLRKGEFKPGPPIRLITDVNGKVLYGGRVPRVGDCRGVSETCSLGTLRFDQLANAYFAQWEKTHEQSERFKLWTDEIKLIVIHEMGQLWRGHAGWFKKDCRPNLSGTLSGLDKNWIKKARITEIDRLNAAKSSRKPSEAIQGAVLPSQPRESNQLAPPNMNQYPVSRIQADLHASEQEGAGCAEYGELPQETKKLGKSAEASDGVDSATSAMGEPPPRSEINLFLKRVFTDEGRRITRTNLWQVAGYKDATQFERFQRDKRASYGSKIKFRAILKMDSKSFIARLDNLA